MPTVLFAPNAFKGSIAAPRAAELMQIAASRVGISRTRGLPIADGGDGSLEVLLGARVVGRRSLRVTGPLGEQVQAVFGWEPETRRACIESAQACGLVLIPNGLRSPLNTTTHGVGELLHHCLELDATSIDLLVGGTSTVDGGLGAAAALGCHLHGREGMILKQVRGRDLPEIEWGQLGPLATIRERARFRLLSDVSNPLCGPRGAAAVFGPQKGASPGDVELLDRELQRLYGALARTTGRDVRDLAGAGAGGGLGALALQFLCDQATSGADAILDLLRWEQALAGVDLVVTGEGRLDASSLMGKAPAVAARRCRALGVPCAAVVGRCLLSKEELRAAGFEAVEETGPRGRGEEKALVAATARLLKRLFPR